MIVATWRSVEPDPDGKRRDRCQRVGYGKGEQKGIGGGTHVTAQQYGPDETVGDDGDQGEQGHDEPVDGDVVGMRLKRKGTERSRRLGGARVGRPPSDGW